MPYTSGQYKWMLYQRLRQAFSLQMPADRTYTQTFFLQLFEDLTVTEAAYNSFVAQMDQELDHMAELGVYKCDQIPRDEIESGTLVLAASFAQIGVQLTIEPGSGDNYDATFVKPDGRTMVYTVGPATNYFYVNARAGTEYRYAGLSAPAYDVTRDVEDADTMDPRVAGPDTWWSYDASGEGTMTITGDGAYVAATQEAQMGSGPYTTIVIGAQVSRLCSDCMDVPEIATIVVLAPADAPMQIDNSFMGVMKNERTLTIYADNLDFRNFSWPDTYTITWHSLDEWEG